MSLGVDLVPHKVCTYSCIYCQLGPTTGHTIERRDFFEADRVLRDVENALGQGPRPDVITFAGSGEPTLYRSLDRIIEGIRSISDVPLLLITNGSLLFMDDVRASCLNLDIAAPSLDACDGETFMDINQPASGISFDRMLEGLRAFSREFRGKCRLEVMLMQGLNDSDEHLDKFTAILKDIECERIDVNTPVRPGWNEWAAPCSKERLEKAREMFGPRAEIVASYERLTEDPKYMAAFSAKAGDLESRIVEMLSRRPCTVQDISSALHAHGQEVTKIIEKLLEQKRIAHRNSDDGVYFFVNS